jgi:hypothetical protein
MHIWLSIVTNKINVQPNSERKSTYIVDIKGALIFRTECQKVEKNTIARGPIPTLDFTILGQIKHEICGLHIGRRKAVSPLYNVQFNKNHSKSEYTCSSAE